MADIHWSSVRLLLDFAQIEDGLTTFFDQSYPEKTFTTNSTAQISGDDLLLADSNDYISSPDHADFELGAGDFTLEFFGIQFDSAKDDQIIASKWDAYSPGSNQRSWLFRVFPTGGFLEFFGNSSGSSSGSSSILQSTFTPTLGVDYNITVERAADVWRIYVDGAMIGSTTRAFTFSDVGSNFAIGALNTKSSGNEFGLIGAVRAVRLTKVARYASDAGYTVPVLPLETTDAPTPRRTTQGVVETMTVDPTDRLTQIAVESVTTNLITRSTQATTETLTQNPRQRATLSQVETITQQARPRATQTAVETLRSVALARIGLRKRSAAMTWDTLIELVEVNLKTADPNNTYQQFPGAPAGILRFSPNWSGSQLNDLEGEPEDNPVIFREMKFLPCPIKAEGFSWSINSQLPRPKLSVADMAGTLLVLATGMDDLLDCEVTYWMTDINFLDYYPGTSTPGDPGNGDALGPEIFRISSMTADGFSCTFELISQIDQPNATIPRRRMLRKDFPGIGRQ